MPPRGNQKLPGGHLDVLTFLVNSPLGQDHAVCDVDGLHANGGQLILVDLVADLATPLRTSDALSVQITRIVGEVVPTLETPRARRIRRTRRPRGRTRVCVCTRGWTSSG